MTGPGTNTAMLFSHNLKPGPSEKNIGICPGNGELEASAKRARVKLSPESAAAYVGRYYSEPLGVFYASTLDEDGTLLCESSRAPHYLLGDREVKDDQILLDRGPIFRPVNPTKGRFLRNADK